MSENPPLKLTWADLLIQDVTEEDFGRWITCWSGSVGGRAAVVFLNKFGVWFLRRSEGGVDMLDVFTGDVSRVADSLEAFHTQVNEPAWQEVYLASRLVYALHEQGKIPGPGECYAVVPHPALGGPNPLIADDIDPQRIMIMPMYAWQSLCAQSVAG